MIGQAGPEYRQAAEVIKSKITAGEDGFEIDGMLTIVQVREITGAKYATARAAVDHLKAEGILEGHQGKGYRIVATPADAASERTSIKELSEQVAELREMAERDGLDEIRARVGRIEAILASWALKLGYENPYGGTRDTAEKAPRRGRAAR